jgi:superfamily II DNA or RNA helicase
VGQLVLNFDAGTLTLAGAGPERAVPPAFQWDARVSLWRAPAWAYYEVLRHFYARKIAHEDRAKQYDSFEFRVKQRHAPRPYQEDAIAAWKEKNRRGCVILPTGAGKTLVAQMAIEMTGRATLVIVPTIDLMNQWYDALTAAFDAEIGLMGGGYFERGAITVTTYASAFRHMERLGDKFGLLIADECHHLPGSAYRYAAELAIAPFRLGLTATPERADGEESALSHLLGPIVYRQEIQHLAGEYLADYRLEQVFVELSAREREAYEQARQIYRDFVRRERISFAGIDGWQRFVIASARSEAGRRAMKAYRESKKIALGTDAKMRALGDLLIKHPDERVLIFTAENDIVYRISEWFLVPAITHHTPVKERKRWLEAFNAGEVLALATSKVLNEGVNIPDASIAVVLSGSGSSREHIQRLGRILRPRPGKQATLYEVVSRDTAEENISERRGQASAFQKEGELWS